MARVLGGTGTVIFHNARPLSLSPCNNAPRAFTFALSLTTMRASARALEAAPPSVRKYGGRAVVRVVSAATQHAQLIHHQDQVVKVPLPDLKSVGSEAKLIRSETCPPVQACLAQAPAAVHFSTAHRYTRLPCVHFTLSRGRPRAMVPGPGRRRKLC